MFRDMSMAYAFGTQPSIAAFMVAFRFAHLLRRLFGEGALQTAFIPEFEALRHQNQERAFAFFRSLTHVLTLFLVVVITIGCLVLACFVWSGHLHPGSQEIVFLTLIMLPSLLFICLFGLNASLLQCEKSYFIPSVAPVTFNAIWVVTVLLLKEMPPEKAMPWLSFGVVIACLFQWLITLPRTRKSLKEMARIPQSLRAGLPDLIRLGKPLTLGILGVAASQINSALDSLFARFAESEGPAWLWYAIRIQQLPLALFGIAIAGAILPLVEISKSRKNRGIPSLLGGCPVTHLVFHAAHHSSTLCDGRHRRKHSFWERRFRPSLCDSDNLLPLGIWNRPDPFRIGHHFGSCLLR